MELTEWANLQSEFLEFMGWIMSKSKVRRVIASYFRSEHQIGSAQESAELRKEFKRLVKVGWKVDAHLHNHPVVLQDGTGRNISPLIPSKPDLDFYTERRVQRALITNGLETVEFNVNELQRLKDLAL